MAAIGAAIGAGIAGAGLVKSIIDSEKARKDKKSEDKKRDHQRDKLNTFGQEMANKRAEAEKGVTAPTMTAERIDRSQVGNVGSQTSSSSELGKAMMDRAMGRGGPSVAEQQLKRSSDQAFAQQLAAGRASGSAAGMRQAQRAGQALQQNIAGQAATLRAQEQQAAQQAASQLQQADFDRQLKADMANQGVDLDVLKSNAAAGNQAALANLDAALRSKGMNDAQIRAYIQGELGALTGAGNMIPQAQQPDNAIAGGLLQAGGSVLGSSLG